MHTCLFGTVHVGESIDEGRRGGGRVRPGSKPAVGVSWRALVDAQVGGGERRYRRGAERGPEALLCDPRFRCLQGCY